MYANYAWIIDKDYLQGDDIPEPRYNEQTGWFEHVVPKNPVAVDVTGPRNVHPKAIELLKEGKGTAFQLWDDDGIRYYSGRFFENLDGLGLDDVNTAGYCGDPLDDYGAPNAGCTHMTIKNGERYIG